MARMRTIKQTMKYLKEQDSETAITEWGLRQLIKSGQLRTHKAGNKNLINLDYLIEYLNSPPEEQENDCNDYGILRKVK